MSYDLLGLTNFQEIDSLGNFRNSDDCPEDNTEEFGRLYASYDNIFRIFYGKRPHFDDSNFDSIAAGCISVIEVAQFLGCVDKVREPIERTLQKQGQSFYRAIAANAVPWMDIGQRLRSHLIFKESLIHVVGQWNAFGVEDKERLDGDVLTIIERKHAELRAFKQATEFRMVGHYSPNCFRDESYRKGRNNYCNDIYTWMCLGLFRQWFGQNVNEGNNYAAPDGGAAFYRKIGEGGEAYLDKDDIDAFHNHFPMSYKANAVFADRLCNYKHEIKGYVEPLIVNHAMIDTDRFPLPYLTCTVVQSSKGDYPWLVARAEAEQKRSKNGQADSDSSPSDLDVK